MGTRSGLIETCARLVEFPTYEERGMRDCSGFLGGELSELDFSVRTDRLNNIFAEKSFDGKGAFLINTHFDTISPSARWSRDPLHVSLEGERLYGLGTSDAKGGIAGILHALRRLETCRFGKLVLLLSNYEDNNVTIEGQTWLGTPYFLEHNRLMADFGLNVEGTVHDDKFMVSTGCGGRVGFVVTTLGKEAHSSDPRLGRNAIYEMMKVIQALRELPPARMVVDDFEAYTELNVSMIEGGTAINIVPGECKITCERRVLPNEDWNEVKERVVSVLNTLADINLRVDFYKPQKSYLLDQSHEVVSLIRASVLETLGYTPRLRVESGRTDSMYLYHIAGIKTVIFGPGEVAHIPDEYVNVKRLEEFSRIMHRLLSKRI